MLLIKPSIKFLAIIATVLMANTFVGCGDKDRNPDPPKKPAGQNNVLSDMVATKDKARDRVNNAMDENKKKLDEAMKNQDGEQAPTEETK